MSDTTAADHDLLIQLKTMVDAHDERIRVIGERTHNLSNGEQALSGQLALLKNEVTRILEIIDKITIQMTAFLVLPTELHLHEKQCVETGEATRREIVDVRNDLQSEMKDVKGQLTRMEETSYERRRETRRILWGLMGLGAASAFTAVTAAIGKWSGWW